VALITPIETPMKTVLLLILSACMAFGQQPLLPYEYHFVKDGRPNKQVFVQSPDEPDIVLGTRYSLADAKTPFYQKKETVRFVKADVLTFIVSDMERIRAERAAQTSADQQYRAVLQAHREAEAEESRRKENAENIKKLGEAVEKGVQKALEQDRILRD